MTITKQIKRLARQLQSILDANPDPPPAGSASLDARYRGPVDDDGMRLPDMRGKQADHAGYAAEMEFRRTHKPPSFAPFRDRSERARRFDEQVRQARETGIRNYLTAFVLDELAAISDPKVLQDLGIYWDQLVDGTLGKEAIPELIGRLARSRAEGNMPLEPLAPVVLGIARKNGFDPARPGEALLDRLTEFVPADARRRIQEAIAGVLAQQSNTRTTYQERLEDARRARFAQAADFLANHASEEDLTVDEAAVMAAEVLSRTSAGRFRLSEEFRIALSQRFSSTGFGNDVAARLTRLWHEREEARAAIDWNASFDLQGRVAD
jgi:hypothetical protein